MADTPLDLTLDAAQLTAQLVDFPSESGTEKPLADAIETALRALPHLTVDRYGNNVVARTNLGRAERVILAGHIDTVPIADNVPSRLDEDGVLWGCGTCDMKSGVAVQLRIAATVPAPNRDLTFVFYDNEEVAADLNGLRACRRGPPRLAGGRLRGPPGADRRPGRGRLPGHAAGPPEDQGRAGALGARAGWAPTRSTRPPRSSPGWPRTSRASRSSTASSSTRASTPYASRAASPPTSSPTTAPSSSTSATRPTAREEEASAFVRDFFADCGVDEFIVDDHTRRRPPRPDPPRRGGLHDGGRRRGRGPSSAGRTSPASARSAYPAVNYGPGNPLSPTRWTSGWRSSQIPRAEKRLRAWLTA